jgi:hypothetical protein
MSIYRTYLAKQATLIYQNSTNNSQNPVLEIVRNYDIYSRYIFSIDLTDLRNNVINYNDKKTLVYD